MEDDIRDKGIAQLIAERQGKTPRGAFSKSSFDNIKITDDNRIAVGRDEIGTLATKYGLTPEITRQIMDLAFPVPKTEGKTMTKDELYNAMNEDGVLDHMAGRGTTTLSPSTMDKDGNIHV